MEPFCGDRKVRTQREREGGKRKGIGRENSQNIFGYGLNVLMVNFYVLCAYACDGGFITCNYNLLIQSPPRKISSVVIMLS